MEIRNASFNSSSQILWKSVPVPYPSKIPKAYYTSEESMIHLCYFFSVLSIGAIGFSLCLLYTLETSDKHDATRRKLKKGGTVGPDQNYTVENDSTSNKSCEIFTLQTVEAEKYEIPDLKTESSSGYLTSLVWAMKIFIINIIYLVFIAILFSGIGTKYQFPATLIWIVGTSVTAVSNYVLNLILLIKYFNIAEDGFGSRMSDKCINVAYMVIIVLLDVVFLWSGCVYLYYIIQYPYPAKPTEKYYKMFYPTSTIN